MVDHIHLAVPDQGKAVEWYRKHFDGKPTTEAPERLMFGETRIIFQKNEAPRPSSDSVLDHIGFSVADLDLALRDLAADGAGQLDASLTQERITAMLAGSFGAGALLVAGLGLYGVTAYSAARRRTEIGIRMALGAAPAEVVRLVLSRVTMLVGVGVIVGAGISLWASRFVAPLLYGLGPRDPLTLFGATAALAAIGALAGWMPAHRASRIDPAEVLRET